jgi:GNAT superfamily N-acetyltransferase
MLNQSSKNQSMNIREYDDVNPLGVLHLTMLALDFPLTPDHAAHIRRTDPRPFPFFTVNAVQDEIVLGQVGVFLLPFVSIEGREDVGGVWAVSTHPQYSGRGIASTLLDEAHSRMREAGLRFSTLGTNRYRIGYKLYQKHGYIDMNVWATAFAPWDTAHQPTRLRAQPLGAEGYDFVEQMFKNIAADYLGFAVRHTPFIRLRDRVNLENIWILWEYSEPVGYVFVNKKDLMLHISIQILRMGIKATESIAAIVNEFKISYVQVNMNRPSDIASFRSAGWQVAHPNWDTFMVKPLIPEVTLEDTRRLFGFGTDRFLISWLDVT